MGLNRIYFSVETAISISLDVLLNREIFVVTFRYNQLTNVSALSTDTEVCHSQNKQHFEKRNSIILIRLYNLTINFKSNIF